MHFSKAIVAALLAAANVAMALPISDEAQALKPRAELAPETRGGTLYSSQYTSRKLTRAFVNIAYYRT